MRCRGAKTTASLRLASWPELSVKTVSSTSLAAAGSRQKGSCFSQWHPLPQPRKGRGALWLPHTSAPWTPQKGDTEASRKDPQDRTAPRQEGPSGSLLHHVGVPPVGVLLWLGGQDPCACGREGQRQWVFLVGAGHAGRGEDYRKVSGCGRTLSSSSKEVGGDTHLN